MLKLIVQFGGIPYKKDPSTWNPSVNPVSPYIQSINATGGGIQYGGLKGLCQFNDPATDNSYIWLHASYSYITFIGEKGFGTAWAGDTGTVIPQAVARWKPNTNYLVGQTVKDSNGHTQQCVQFGKSGSTEPVWQEINAFTKTVKGIDVLVSLGGQTPDGPCTSLRLFKIVRTYAGDIAWQGYVTYYVSNGGVVWQDTGTDPVPSSVPILNVELALGTYGGENSLLVSRNGTMYANIAGANLLASHGLLKWSNTGTFEGDILYSPDGYEGKPAFDGFWANPALDDLSGLIMDALDTTFTVWDTTTKLKKLTMNLPSQAVSVALQQLNRVYVLCKNRVLVLIDYVKGVVLGATKLQSSVGAPTFVSASTGNAIAVLGWDQKYQRVMLAERTPDNDDGTCSVVIRAFSPIPQPVRLTKPIPLSTPRKNTTVRVLTQQVGDMNEGVSGGLVSVVVTGPGTLATGIPLPDGEGRTIFGVKCTDVGDITVTVTANV